METLKVRIEGTTAILMHNVRLANPLDHIVKQIREYTSKRKKTDEDHAMVARLEFEGGLYHDADVGPFIPGQNVEAAIHEAAKLSKQGKDVKRALHVLEDKIPLEYEGPRKIEAMWKKEEQFVDMRSVKIQGSRLMRCRPIFHPPWSCEFTVVFDSAMLNTKDVAGFLNTAGLYTRLCDGRPRYGGFTVASAV